MLVLVFRCWLLLVFLWASLATAQGQQTDPFGGQDPFDKRIRSARDAKPIVVTFVVMDDRKQPVADARIRGPGIVRVLTTGQDGEAVTEINERILRSWAARMKGRLRFHAMPSADDVMPPKSEWIMLNELLKTNRIQFQTVPGVRLFGRVVGQRDKEPIPGVEVRIDPTGSAAGSSTRHVTTDDSGNWSVVSPLADAEITLGGNVEGYKLSDSSSPPISYKRLVKVNNDDKGQQIRVPDFSVQQIEPLKIRVTSLSGEPVRGAQVVAYHQRWLDDQIVIWEKVARQQETGGDGTCRLSVEVDDVDAVIIAATAERDQSRLEGRAVVSPVSAETIPIVVEPPCPILGTLLRDGQPATGIELVLYEAIRRADGKWTTVGLRSTTTTDNRGNYQFEAPVGIYYLIATKERDADGKQPTVHRSEHPTTSIGDRVPEVNLK